LIFHASLVYGPSKPHLGHLYGLPNLRHRLHRHIIISPQFGHGNFVASVPGGIILWHDVHTGTVTVIVGFSLIVRFLFRRIRNSNVCLAYMCYVLCLLETFFVCVCAHRVRPPSIRILIGSKYEVYHLIGGDRETGIGGLDRLFGAK